MSVFVRLVKCSALFALAGCSALVQTDPSELGGGSDAGTVDGGPITCAGGCDDGIACTVDSCVGDACSFAPNDALCGAGERCNPGSGCVPLRCTTDADCNDRNACNGTERCGGEGADPVTGCSGGGPIDCDDGVPCTSDRCDPAMGCVSSPIDAACDDGVSCTVDRCDAVAGCVRTPNDGLCDDGVCFEGGRCDAARGCVGGTAVDCNDGNACTGDFCDPTMGCRNPARDDDGDGARIQFADGMGCGGDDCDDTNPAIRPGADELCNGVDDDCDGDIDENPDCEATGPDECGDATAIPLAANTGSLTGTFVGLGDDYDTLCETNTRDRSAVGGSARGDSPDAIHYFDLPSGNWDVRVDTQGSSVDTVLALATTCGEFDLGGLGCNDDANYTVGTWSRMWMHRIGSAISTTRVFVLVEPYGTSASGNYTINVQITTAANDRCGEALDIRGGGTVIGFPSTVSISGAARGSCQPDGSFLEGEQLFFYGNGASAESPAVFEVYASGFTADVYARSTCSNAMTESRCAVGTGIGGGINRARIEVPVGGTVFADGLTGGSSIYSLYYDP